MSADDAKKEELASNPHLSEKELARIRDFSVGTRNWWTLWSLGNVCCVSWDTLVTTVNNLAREQASSKFQFCFYLRFEFWIFFRLTCLSVK